MNLRPIAVGRYVTIRVSSEYYGRDDDVNPAGECGIVEMSADGGGHSHRVRWLHNGKTNIYRRLDLKYWVGEVPPHKVRVARPKPEPQKELDEGGINKAVVEAIEKCKNEGQNVTARYAFVYKTGKTEVCKNTACHHTVLDREGEAAKKFATIVTMIGGHNGQKNNLTEEENLFYYDWLLNRSPWALAFTTKDTAEAYKQTRYVRMNLAAPGNMVQGALIATRQPWEHHHVIKTFKLLADKGVPENTAFLLGCMFRQVEKDVLTPSFQGGGHFPIEINYMRKIDCLSFINNTPPMLNEAYNEGGPARGVHDMFVHRDIKRERDEVSMTDYARQVAKKAGAAKGKLVTNPFAAAKKVESRNVEVDDLVNYVLTQGIFV